MKKLNAMRISLIRALPDMQGAGKVRDLRQASSQRADLATLLADYSRASTREEQLAQIDTLIATWGDTASMGMMQSRAAENGYGRVANDANFNMFERRAA